MWYGDTMRHPPQTDGHYHQSTEQHSLLGNLGFKLNHFSAGLVIGAIVLLGLLTLAFVISNDANKRGRSGILWGLATLFLPIFTVPIYLITVLGENKQPVQKLQVVEKPAHVFQKQVVEERNETYEGNLEEKSEFPINEVTKTSTQFCTQCGAKNSMRAIYCNTCGNKVS